MWKVRKGELEILVISFRLDSYYFMNLKYNSAMFANYFNFHLGYHYLILVQNETSNVVICNVCQST